MVIDPDTGKLLKSIDFGHLADRITSLAFGGPELMDIYVTSGKFLLKTFFSNQIFFLKTKAFFSKQDLLLLKTEKSKEVNYMLLKIQELEVYLDVVSVPKSKTLSCENKDRFFLPKNHVNVKTEACYEVF